MSRLRIVVGEDSLTIRRHLCEILSADPDIEVVGEAADGKRAIELVELLRPDVVTLDMVMPVLSGLAATEYIMAYYPTPILIVSASLNRGELFKTYDALAAGAVDVLEKPSAVETGTPWERRLITTVKLIAKIKVITHVKARLMHGFTPVSSATPATPAAPAAPAARLTAATSTVAASGPTPTPRSATPWPTPPWPTPPWSQAGPAYRLIAIGASTGGPQAIVEVLNRLPLGMNRPILFVMHIGEPFGAAFAEWLDSQTPHRVIHAEDGVKLDALNGRVVMAPPGRHLVVERGQLRLTDIAPRHSCRPSVDVLFESLAADPQHRVVAALLTGMGRDGASGLLALRNAGAYTIAQDESSCVVYGMPREAALLGAARAILPLTDIGPQIERVCNEVEAPSP